jgi:GT2 family glycosyltransferase
MNNLTLSVIIPAYERAAVLERTLDALRATDHPDTWEVIIVDDGSKLPLSSQLPPDTVLPLRWLRKPRGFSRRILNDTYCLFH